MTTIYLGPMEDLDLVHYNSNQSMYFKALQNVIVNSNFYL